MTNCYPTWEAVTECCPKMATRTAMLAYYMEIDYSVTSWCSVAAH